MSTIILQVPGSDPPASVHRHAVVGNIAESELSKLARATESPAPQRSEGDLPQRPEEDLPSQLQPVQVQSLNAPMDSPIECSSKLAVSNQLTPERQEEQQQSGLQDPQHSLIDIEKSISRPSSKQSQLNISAEENPSHRVSTEKPFPDIHSQLSRRKVKDLLQDEHDTGGLGLSLEWTGESTQKPAGTRPGKRKSGSPSKPLVQGRNVQTPPSKRSRKASSSSAKVPKAQDNLQPLKLQPMPSPEASGGAGLNPEADDQSRLIIDSATRKVSVIKFSKHGPVNQGRWGYQESHAAGIEKCPSQVGEPQEMDVVDSVEH